MARLKKEEKFETNPFARNAVVHTVTGKRMVFANPSEDTTRFAMVSREDGEDHGDISFGRRITVDKTNFLKFYADGVRMFLGLKSAGIKVFMIIYQQLLDSREFQQDKILLNYDMLEDDIQETISRATFFRGIAELKKVHFLAPTPADSTFWINIDYVFKGDRLTLVNQYILDPKYTDTLNGNRPMVDNGQNDPRRLSK